MDASMGEATFQLSAQLQAHSSEVRSILVLPDGSFVSGSYDTTAVLWSLKEGKYVPVRTFSGHPRPVLRVAYCPPTAGLPSGSIVTTCLDGGVRQFDLASDAPGIEIGRHEKEACPVAVQDGKVYSGAWDGKVILWQDKRVAREWDLKKHVYALTVLPDGTVLAGCMDSRIYILHSDGTSTPLASHTAQVQQIVPTATGFASCANDGSVRFWAGVGAALPSCVQSIQAHSTMIFGLAILNGSVASASEDRSVAIHDITTGAKYDTLPHPHVVWTVVALPNGDIVTGCGDSVVRIFTKDPARVASADELAAYQSMLINAETPKQQGGAAAGSDDLQEPGKQDGEVRVVGSEAFSWSDETQTWNKLGDVVAQPQQESANVKYDTDGRPIIFGRKYDYAFDVNLNDGPIKLLGFDKGENPYVAAQRFIDQEELPQHFLDEVADWVTQHVPVNEIGSAYVRPPPTPQTAAPAQIGVFNTTVVFEQFNADGIKRKITEFNAQVAPELTLNEKELGLMLGCVDTLAKTSFYHTSAVGAWPPTLLARKMLHWPVEKRFPAVDIVRAMFLHPASAPVVLKEAGLLDGLLANVNEAAGNNNTMLAIRALCNMFRFDNVMSAAAPRLGDLLSLVGELAQSSHANTKAAVATFVLNVSIYALSKSGLHDLKVAAASIASELLGSSEESTATRAAHAVGNLAWKDKEVAQYLQVLDTPSALRTASASQVSGVAAAARVAQQALEAALK
eukprot:TRINITY_DN1021_c0_g1_i1.p1 TRINITY_DN1021_c0_g1~~TRINITY_DN1021_c0_g1_i1.p1  ORF type:complete len:736 (+),score=194.62 TRINITY_DN1021_c0_g1_i1:88-2295(+)